MENKTKYLIILILLSACEGSTAWREKHGLIKTFEVTYDITSLRVDDDAEYHVTAISRSNGLVESLSDMDFLGTTTDDIKIRYTSTTKPIMIIKYSDRNYGEGNFAREIGEPYIINLPAGYKIDTFED